VNEIKKIFFAYPIFLTFLLVISSFLSANLFVNSEYTFAVWFILMLVSFATGWLMNSGFMWNNGIKVILITTLISVVITLMIVALFRNNFDMNSSLVGNLVLYSLRVLVLGLSAVFGLSFSENMKNVVQKNDTELDTDIPEASISDKAEYYINEAKLKADKLLFEAEKEAHQIRDRKTQIEMQLRELIHTEREVIRKYESEENSVTTSLESSSE
jgi:vacuolar-type H+-ATPase subunit H